MVKNKLRCGLCLFFHKECVREATMNTEACNEFKIAKIFYCPTRGCFMDTIACASIMKNKREGTGGEYYSALYSMCSKSCTDGNIIEARLNQMQTKIKFIRRGELVAFVAGVKEGKSKLKIIRRR